jgi:hypothetical protein
MSPKLFCIFTLNYREKEKEKIKKKLAAARKVSRLFDICTLFIVHFRVGKQDLRSVEVQNFWMLSVKPTYAFILFSFLRCLFVGFQLGITGNS